MGLRRSNVAAAVAAGCVLSLLAAAPFAAAGDVQRGQPPGRHRGRAAFRPPPPPLLASALALRGGADETRKRSFLSLLFAPARLVTSGLRRLLFGRRAAAAPRGGDAAAAAAAAPSSSKKGAKKSAASPASSSHMGRLQSELRDFVTDPPDFCKVSVGKNLKVWCITLTGVDGTVYAGEKYRLRVKFPDDYPTAPPSVYFLHPVPRHQHVYTNGDICLSLLGRDWRPQLTVSGLALSILSMLSSAKAKTIPPDNAGHADAKPGQKQTAWVYHDDSC